MCEVGWWAGSEYRGLGERRRRLRPHLCDEIYPAVGSVTPPPPHRCGAREAMVGINSAQLIDCELWGFSSARIWVECQSEEAEPVVRD